MNQVKTKICFHIIRAFACKNNGKGERQLQWKYVFVCVYVCMWRNADRTSFQGICVPLTNLASLETLITLFCYFWFINNK